MSARGMCGLESRPTESEFPVCIMAIINGCSLEEDSVSLALVSKASLRSVFRRIPRFAKRRGAA